MSTCCAIDFGTSNSAIALPDAAQVRLVELEPGFTGMPTAVFYAVEDLAQAQEPDRRYGRAAVAAYVDGVQGRLMRSMKSILGSSLAGQTTALGAGHSVRYLDVVAAYLRHLKAMAERASGTALEQVVLGRPVFFVDDDPPRDRAAQAALEQAARQVGFHSVEFQYEPIAAALDFEATIEHEQLVLVADIGGGTSDFSLVRVGPQRRLRADRRSDILANHGVHVAGTDFDRQVELQHILPCCGYRGRGPHGREVPSKVYFDLATWHLINTVYAPARSAELRAMKPFYADPQQHARLMTVIRHRLGHALAARAEEAKIAIAQQALKEMPGSALVSLHPGGPGEAWAGGGQYIIDLQPIEPGLQVSVSACEVIASIDAEIARITAAARHTLALAGIGAAQVDALYFTGGSTGLAPLAERIAALFPQARSVRGDRFASVAMGLGRHAQRVFR